MWIDLSVPLNHSTICWPTDSPCIINSKVVGSVMSSTVHCSCHGGTHIDAPAHHIKDANLIDQIPLSHLCGIAQIIEITTPQISVEHLPEISQPKVIFKTPNTFGDTFDPEYCYLTPEAAHHLVNSKVHFVGTDYLSIEEFSSTTFDTHNILLRAGVVIAESIDTSALSSGLYEIVALPIRLAAEASPARIIARRLP